MAGMIAIDTELLYWTCPDCASEQEIITIKGIELDPILECIDCGHESPPLKYELDEE